MAPETVTVGDTEVEIRETDDGFEAVEADNGPDLDDFHGKFLRVKSSGSYGFKMPLGEALAGSAKVDTEEGFAVWDTSKDVSGLHADGASSAKRVLDPAPHQDGYASVDRYEIVDE